MGYLHINNLYKDQTILMFKECYAMEKIHGTSAHIGWNAENKELSFFSGGEKHERFVALFDITTLKKVFLETFIDSSVVIYGEAYGGKQQGMSDTYGKELKFIGFDVKIEDLWLNVPNAKQVCDTMGIEFVDYVQIPAIIDTLDAAKTNPSTQAIRNACGNKEREGVVLRPLVELTLNNGNRVISKHKNDSFMETKTPRKVNPEDFKVLVEAKEIAEEWVTEMRLSHVLDKFPQDIGIESMKMVIEAMTEDVFREGEDEIVKSPAVKKYIGSRTAILFKHKLQNGLKDLTEKELTI